jgi:hypothetical protein
MTRRSVTRWLGLAASAAVALGAGAALRYVRASDHQDTPFVEFNPKSDLTDVYAFPGAQSGRIVLAMDTRAFLTPADAADPTEASFDHNLLYQFKIDTDGDAKEDKVLQITFSDEGADQKVELRGPLAPPVQCAMQNEIADAGPALSGAINTALGDPSEIQLFAGPRDDPFFLDLEAAFCVLPDRRPVQGPLSGSCALTPSQPGTPFFFRSPGVDYLNFGGTAFNVNSIVVELPASMIEGSAPGKIGIWGTISQ